MNFPILSAIIFIPLIGALFILITKGEQKRDMLEREGARMTEQFDISKQEKMLDIASGRKQAADQAIANASAQLDQFVSGALTGGISGLAGGAGGALFGGKK